MKKLVIALALIFAATISFAQRTFEKDITVKRDIRGERYIVLGAGADTTRMLSTVAGLAITAPVATTFSTRIDVPSIYSGGSPWVHKGAGAGVYNIFVGELSGAGASNGGANSSLGISSFASITSGSLNVGVGYESGKLLTSGGKNVFIGRSAGENMTTGGQNTIIGYYSGSNTLGSSNVFLGYRAGQNETGSAKLYIDNDSITTPLIYGDFTTNELTINGNLYSTSIYAATGVDTIASADTLTLTGTSNNIVITGTDTIVYINTTAVPNYAIIYILFSGSASGVGVTAGSNLKIAGDFAYSPDDILVLQRRGVNFYELSRSVN